MNTVTREKKYQSIDIFIKYQMNIHIFIKWISIHLY